MGAESARGGETSKVVAALGEADDDSPSRGTARVDEDQRPVYAAADGKLHLAAVDGLRALAALFVVAHHIHRTVWGTRTPSPNIRIFVEPLLYGHFAVSIFIVISGFCLMLPVIRHGGALPGGAWRFYKRRAVRIIPAYYCAILFVVLFSYHFVSAKNLVAHLLLVHNLSPDTYSGINAAFWSIAVECQIYLVFPLLVWLWGRWGPALTVTSATFAGYAGYFYFFHHPSRLAGLTPHYLALFSFGMLGAAVAAQPGAAWAAWRDKRGWGQAALLAAVAVCLMCAVWGRTIERTGWGLADWLVGLGAACLLVAVSRPASSGLAQRVLSWGPLVWIGTFSYSLYLIHWPLLGILYDYAHVRWHLTDAAAFASLALLGIPLIVVIAQRFYIICELPSVVRLRTM